MVQYFYDIDDRSIQEELYNSTARRMGILLASLGLSVSSHINSRSFPPTWEDLLQQIVEWCIENPDSAVKENFNNLLEEGRVKRDRFQDAVRIIDEFLIGERKITCLSKVLLCDQVRETDAPDFLHQPFHEYFHPTSDYNAFIDRTYLGAAVSSLGRFYKKKGDIQNAIEAYKKKEPFVVELYSTTEKHIPEPIPKVLNFSRLVFESLSDPSGNYWGSFQKLLSDPCTVLLQVEESPQTMKRWIITKKGQIFQPQAEILWDKGKITTVEYETDDQLITFLEKLPLPPVEIYIASAQKDKKLREELEKHLRRLQKSLLSRCNIVIWDGGEITAGTEWRTEFKEHLERAHVILLLISPDLLDSEFDRRSSQDEIKRALERHDNDEARVIPVLLRDCIWEDEKFSELMILPSNQRPVTLWSNRDQALKNVAVDIRKAIIDLVSKLYPNTL